MGFIFIVRHGGEYKMGEEVQCAVVNFSPSKLKLKLLTHYTANAKDSEVIKKVR